MRLTSFGEEADRQIEQGKAALDIQPDVIQKALQRVFENSRISDSPATLEDHVLEDADLNQWCRTATAMYTESGKTLLSQLIQRPTTHVDLLRNRQNAILSARAGDHVSSSITDLLAQAKEAEADALWVIARPSLEDTWPLPWLFPSMFLLRNLNRMQGFHEAYHFYRLWMSPAMTILYPLTIILGPYFYLRVKLGFPLTFRAYVTFALQAMKAIKGAVAYRMYVSLAIYACLYLYGVAQAIDIVTMIRTSRKILVKRARNVRKLLAAARALQRMLPLQDFGAPILDTETSMSPYFKGVWQWWGSPAVDAEIKKALQVVAAADVVALGARSLDSGLWCAPDYGSGAAGSPAAAAWPRLWNMRHPTLGARCVANPAALDRMVIVTGPNAGGKSTYCRGALANIILAQTLGICCAKRATMRPFDRITSFMRIVDETGTASLFEAEVARCVRMWNLAEDVTKKGGRVFMVLDEPMHATPPTEGAAAAMAFIKGLARMQNVRAMVTTHYAALTSLAETQPGQFVNISMEARMPAAPTTPTSRIQFTYRLNKGASRQSIALELLQERGTFSAAFIADALQLKDALKLGEK